MKALFGSDVKTRFFPSFFPFTEPSADVQISCIFCGGKGCRKCKHSGWIELLGCGMVDPAVFAAVTEERRKIEPLRRRLQPRKDHRLRLRHGCRAHRHDPARHLRHRPLLLRRHALLRAVRLKPSSPKAASQQAVSQPDRTQKTGAPYMAVSSPCVVFAPARTAFLQTAARFFNPPVLCTR